jgi:hypothetical protein
MSYRPIGIVIALLLFLFSGCVTRKKQNPAQLNNQKTVETIPREDSLLTSLLKTNPAFFDSIIKPGNPWKVQILYTQIDRDAANKPIFTTHSFQLQPDSYFYPASTVKMPVAALALQRLNELNIPGLDRESTLITGADNSSQTEVTNDPGSTDGRPTIANYIRKIFLVSDNDAYNRLYEFMGPDYINQSLHRMGFDSARIRHRLNLSLTEEQNRRTNPVKFFDREGRLLLDQPGQYSRMIYPSREIKLGKGYYSGGKLVERPFDFSAKNRITLYELNEILKRILFPEVIAPGKRFSIREDDYEFLYRQMARLPKESQYPGIDSTYPDAYVKFILFGGSGSIPGNQVRIFNKPGDAYGFLTDVAYIVDFEHKVEFMLSATLLCNSDEIFNDDQYDYEKVGKPFLKNLGKVIYDFELNRKRLRVPDLSKFNVYQ